MILSGKEKQLGCMVIKRGSETLVSCYEVQMGLVLLSSARCWGGVWGGACLAQPVQWHCGLVMGPGQAEGPSFTAGMASLMARARPVAAEGPTGSNLEFPLLLPSHAIVLQFWAELGPQGLRVSVTVTRSGGTTLRP